MENFREFLESEMKKRGWKQADLARASNLSTAAISNIINGRRGVGEESIIALAHALNIPRETVFRAAGFLTQREVIDQGVEELNHLFEQLEPDDRAEIIEMIRLKINRQKKTKTSRDKSPARIVNPEK
jgi:transcriptional regulator with XRE-family HTH domain